MHGAMYLQILSFRGNPGLRHVYNAEYTLTLWGQAIVLGASSSLTFRGFILIEQKEQGNCLVKLRQNVVVFSCCLLT